MTFISYAQNFEDVMLWRALKHIPRGFYIDVGANHPEEDSVTKAFYDRGWRGINIEPLLQCHLLLEQQRPLDTNLNLAAGAQDGQLNLFEVQGISGWTTLDKGIADDYRKQGLAVTRHPVPVLSLAGICDKFAPAEIHFIKVDVEGFESEVLRGMDFTRWRPWILVVEATHLNSTLTHYEQWEAILLDNQYQFAYFDGLNRFYVAREHAELIDALSVPPNVFDDFIRLSHVRALELIQKNEVAVREVDAKTQEAEAKVRQANARIQQLDLEIHRLNNDLQAVYASNSWRVTAFLRWLTENIHQLRRRLCERHSERPVKKKSEVRSLTAPPPPPGLPQAVELPWFRLTGHIEGHYSLAIVNRGLAMALDKLTQSHLCLRPHNGHPVEEFNHLPENVRIPLEVMMARQIDARRLAETISIVHHYPLISDSEPARQKFILFFWEETEVPEGFIRTINRDFSAALVASTFVKNALRNSGCMLPLFVIPMGVDHLVGGGVTPIESVTPQPGKRFRFLHLSSAFDRKGVDALLNAYWAAFKCNRETELYIKTFPNPHNRIHQQIAELTRDHPDHSIIVDESPLDDAGLLALYHSAQVLVLPSKGEGFNLPAAEAMAMGLPVIVTGFGGHMEFCSPGTASLIPFHFSRSASHLKTTHSCWVEPETDQLSALLKKLHFEILADSTALAARRAEGLRQVRETYSWENGGKAILKASRWLDDNPTSVTVEPLRVALISPWQTACGLAEHSKHLFGNFPPEQFTIQIYCDSRTPDDPGQSLYRPTWEIGKTGSLASTLGLIEQEACDVLYIEHHPGFYDLGTYEIYHSLEGFCQSGKVVILELHATQPMLTRLRHAPAAITALQSLDRLMVHSVEDMNNLASLGLVDNVTLLPLGVVLPTLPLDNRDIRQKLGLADDDLVIANFGFLLPHKGVDTLIQCISPLSKLTNKNVRLLAINAILDQRSQDALADCRQLAQNLGVSERITWINDYHPLEECIRYLAAADFIIFPYKNTEESASGAVRVGISAGRPVLVSPLGIFDELCESTTRMGGITTKDIVLAVHQLLSDPVATSELMERQKLWLRSNDVTQISRRLQDMIHGLRHDRKMSCEITALTQPMDAPILPGPRPIDASPGTSAKPRQFLVDVSELYFRDQRTGIQRTVRNILAELFKNPPEDFRITPIYSIRGAPFHYTHKFNPPLDVAPLHSDETAVQVSPGDLFLGLDLGVHLIPQIDSILDAWKAAGVSIHFVVYDIIPLCDPNHTQPWIAHLFEAWLTRIAGWTDSLICISQTTATDVKTWLNHHSLVHASEKVCFIHLGAEFDSDAPLQGMPENGQQILEHIITTPSFLSVGTIEPRKGQIQTLKAFERLWEQGVTVNLLIVGKQGWIADESVIRSLRYHPERNHRLFWLENITDGYLEKLYNLCTCLIAASEAEGFGIPIVEAARHYLPIIARDIPIFREVAGNHASYFDTPSPDDLAEVIKDWLKKHETNQAPLSAEIHWLTWAESAQQLLHVIQKTDYHKANQCTRLL